MNFIRAGSTFMMPIPGTKLPHLWIVLTDPDPLTEKVIAVMVVSETDNTDKTLTLNVGDHAFIKWPSHLDYGGAQPFRVPILEGKIAASTNALGETIPRPLLQAVRKAVLTSTRTMHWIKDSCRTKFDDDGKAIVAPTKKKP
ncbi:MAG: hypothetical protein ACR2NS_03480 [Gemmatimonadaceae bacterium]